jgi:hypothetical protein
MRTRKKAQRENAKQFKGELGREGNGGITVPLSVRNVPPLEIVDSIGFVHTKLYRNREFLQQKYVAEGLSLAQISEQICSSKEAVRKALVRFEIPVRESHKPHGHTGRLRFGKRVKAGVVVTHHTEQRVIDTIKELNAKGMGLRQIARTMTQLKVSTKCRGKRWHPQMVARILTGEGR